MLCLNAVHELSTALAEPAARLSYTESPDAMTVLIGFLSIGPKRIPRNNIIFGTTYGNANRRFIFCPKIRYTRKLKRTVALYL